MSGGRRRAARVARYTLGVLLALYAAALLVLLLAPGRLGPAGSLACPRGQGDTFVVWEAEDRGATGAEGALAGPSLFCMGERGDTTEVGTVRPVVYLLGAATAGLAVLALLVWLVRRRFRRRRGPAAEDAADG